MKPDGALGSGWAARERGGFAKIIAYKYIMGCRPKGRKGNHPIGLAKPTGKEFMDQAIRRGILNGFLNLALAAVVTFGIFLATQKMTSAFPRFPLQEEVTVTAVEVPVRVRLHGEAVRDLTKDDFEVFENGVKQEITHFEIISRKISTGEAEFVPGHEAVTPKRLFLLIFNIFDYNDGVGEAIDLFFRDVFRPGDQVTAITEDLVLNLEQGKKTDEIVANLKQGLRKYKAISVQNTQRVFRDLRYEADRLLNALRGSRSADYSLDQAMIRFFENYQNAWDAYRRQYLEPDVAFYQALTRKIRTIEGERWAICFQQRDLFPELKSASRLETEIRNWTDSQINPEDQIRARMVLDRQQDLQRSLALSELVSPDRLRDLFLSADITFHLVLLKSFRTLQDQDFELEEIGQDYEESFRKISRATGGYLAFSNQPAEALREAVRAEDYHYLLVYSPVEVSGRKKREIEVRVKRSGAEVSFLKNYIAARPQAMTIANVKSGAKVLSFSLLHYLMGKSEGKTKGLAEVKITIFDDQSKSVFDEGKTLDLIQKETHISLNLGRLKSGEYFVIIQAFDRLANEQDVYSGMITL